MRFEREILAIRICYLGGHQKACNLLSKKCKCFLLYSPKFNKVSPPFSRGCTHDMFDQWNHVKLCDVFLYFEISYLFLSLPDDPIFLLRRSAITGIKAYQPILQHVIATDDDRLITTEALTSTKIDDHELPQ